MADGSRIRVLAVVIASLVLLNGVALWSVRESAANGDPSVRPTAEGESPGDAEYASRPPDDSLIPFPASPPAGRSDSAQTEALPQLSAAVPPKPGRYTWDNRSERVNHHSSTSKPESGESEDTYRYEVLPSEGGDGRIRQHRDYAESKDGDFTTGGSSHSDSGWTEEGVFELGYRVRSKGRSSDGHEEEWSNGCDWQPPLPEIRYPIQEGTSWEWKSTCHDQHDDSVDIITTRSGRATITRWEVLTIDGREVAAARVEFESMSRTDTRFKGPLSAGTSDPQSLVSEARGLNWFAPAVGLTVRTESSNRASYAESDEFESTSRSVSQLRSTTPS